MQEGQGNSIIFKDPWSTAKLNFKFNLKVEKRQNFYRPKYTKKRLHIES